MIFTPFHNKFFKCEMWDIFVSLGGDIGNALSCKDSFFSSLLKNAASLSDVSTARECSRKILTVVSL